LHPDFELHAAGAEPIFGIDAYRAMRSAYFEGVPDEQVIVEDIFATDDRTVCRWRIRGTHTGTLFGLPPTGRAIDYSGLSIYEVCRRQAAKRLDRTGQHEIDGTTQWLEGSSNWFGQLRSLSVSA
jgi:predicted ester cyclase